MNESIVGKQFGKWTVLTENTKKSGAHRWHTCRCECGTIRDVRDDSLKSGKSVCCGCVGRNKLIQMVKDKPSPNRKNIEGEKFGKLSAIRAIRKDGNTYWVCKCDCGNEVIVLRSNLIRGKTKSCGCEGGICKAIRAYQQNELKENTALCKLGSKSTKANTSGRRGIRFRKKDGLYIASIQFQKKSTYLGCSKDFQEAVSMREDAEQEMFEPMLEKYGRTLAHDCEGEKDNAE